MTLDRDDIQAIATEVARQLRTEFSLPQPLAPDAITPVREYQIRKMAHDLVAAKSMKSRR